MKVKHDDSGACPKCREIMNQKDGLHPSLRLWFEMVQDMVPFFHISCTIRGKVDQEAAFARGASKAHFGESAHNYSPALAMDTFMLKDGKCVWDEEIYGEICGEDSFALPEDIIWYGDRSKTKFYELPHFEIKNWRELVAQGSAYLVDED